MSGTVVNPAVALEPMTKWLTSGRRRDVCVILAGEGPCTGQQLKTRLSRHYDERIDPESFHGALSALVDQGFLEKRIEGIAEEYALTDAGEQRLREHYEWMRTQIDGGRREDSSTLNGESSRE